MKAFLFLLSSSSFVIAQINNIVTISGQVSTEQVTTPILDKTGFGTCTCDKTLNTCDVYCCCDTDCSTNILDYWRANYNTFCTKSYIGNEYRPFSQCIAKKHIFTYNSRMGMEVSDINDQLCVELDTGSIFSDYDDYIQSFNATTA